MTNTIERKKTKGGNYEYFIADIDGNLVKALTGYYKGRVIAEITEKVEDDWGNLKNEIVYRYYEFSYYDETPKKEINKQGYLDTGLNYPQYSEWTEEIGGEEVELKAIIGDTGEILLDKIASVDKYVPEAEAFIVTLYHYIKESMDECWWEEDWNNSKGQDSVLRCVINFEGNFIVKPERYKDIKFIPEHNLFSIGNLYLYNLYGEKESFNFNNLSNDSVQSEFKLEKKYLENIQKKFGIVRDLKTQNFGLIKNGTPIIETIYDEVSSTTWIDVFIVSKDNKYGFIKGGTHDKFTPILLPLLYDEVKELPTYGYLCKINSETKTHYFGGFGQNGDYLQIIYNSLDDAEVIIKVKEIFKDN